MKVKFFNALFVISSLFLCVSSARAEEFCTVSDPNDSSLNVRTSPNGDLEGKISNGTPLLVMQTEYDTKERPWAKVALTDFKACREGNFFRGPGGQSFCRYSYYGGWVFKNYLTCENRYD